MEIPEEKPSKKEVKPIPVATPPTVRPTRKSTADTARLVQPTTPPTVRPTRKAAREEPESTLSESFIPPVVAILPALASEDDHVAELCEQAGQEIEKVFDERLSILFRMLGYETNAVGQARGRVPDGVATSPEFHYAIIYDAAARRQGYSLGSGESTIGEYIIKMGDRLRKQGYRTIYFMVVSNTFNGDYDDDTRSLKIETGVNEVILAEADALLLLLENKLRDPDISLGPKHIQKLLAASGLLSAATVSEFFES